MKEKEETTNKEKAVSTKENKPKAESVEQQGTQGFTTEFPKTLGEDGFVEPKESLGSGQGGSGKKENSGGEQVPSSEIAGK